MVFRYIFHIMRTPAIAGPNGIYTYDRSAPLPEYGTLISGQLSDHLIPSYHINTPIDVTILVNHRFYLLKRLINRLSAIQHDAYFL